MNNGLQAESQKFSLKQAVTRIAVGLVEQQEQISNRIALPITSANKHIKSGIEQLSVLCIRHKIMPPRHHKEVVDWFHRRLEDWPGVLGEFMQEMDFTEPLLFFGRPTDLTYELAERVNQGYEPELEIKDLPFKDILELCTRKRLDHQYVKARLFLVQHSYLEWGTREINRDLEWDLEVRELIRASYEPIPVSCRIMRNGYEQIALCPRCGWPLAWQNHARPRAFCYSDLCSRLVERINYPEKWIPYHSESLRTNRGIQASVVAPEQMLVQLHNTLEAKGLTCQLWPNVDNYDLYIKFPSGITWAIDFKDYSSPRHIALELKPFKQSPYWDKAFYIFPDYRNTTRYNKIFYSIWQEQCQQNSNLSRIEVLFLKKFLAKVDRELKLSKTNDL
ncbi:MAG: hypothetical protein V7L01_34670 [Nostoc sp.]|uniref:restriction endonuclease-related protein n=1 Tax=Nostoc sp. TaxID=1180 RepID=UPI002FF6A724